MNPAQQIMAHLAEGHHRTTSQRAKEAFDPYLHLMDTDAYQEAMFFVVAAALMVAAGLKSQRQLEQVIASAEHRTTVPKEAWRLQAQMITLAIRATELGGPEYAARAH